MKTAVMYFYRPAPDDPITEEHMNVLTFPTEMAALQWVDKNNPRRSTGELTEYTKTKARDLLEGKRTTIYYRGCDLTTNLTENK